MNEISRDALDRYGTGAYQPATFLERGVAVPFTTPFLLGARIRPTETRAGLEIVIANPSGGKGHYIVPWAALPEVCSPTLHDRRLWKRLSDQPAVTPALVRETARAIAAEGLAGREAAEAAAKAKGEDGAARMRANFMLLLDLIRRTESREEATVPPQLDKPDRIEARAKRAVARIAPRMGATPEIVAAWLEGIATAIAGLGVPGDPVPARTRVMVSAIETMIGEIELWIARNPDPGDQQAAALIIDAARMTLSVAKAAIGDLDSSISDTIAMLGVWKQDPSAFSRRATRPDWMLDGWHIIAELWRDADPESRRGVLMEMALLAPMLPREVEEWVGMRDDWDRPLRLRRLVRVNEDWRSGRTFEVVARNERLRARAA